MGVVLMIAFIYRSINRQSGLVCPVLKGSELKCHVEQFDPSHYATADIHSYSHLIPSMGSVLMLHLASNCALHQFMLSRLTVFHFDCQRRLS